MPTYAFTGTASDLGSGLVQVQVSTGTTWIPAMGTAEWAYTWTLPIADSTVYTLTARGLDAASNVGQSVGVPLTVDNVVPTTGIAIPNRSPWITSTVVYTWTSSNDGSGIARYHILIANSEGHADRFAPQRAVLTYTMAYSEGLGYYVQVQPVDGWGNTGLWSDPSTLVTPDLTAPQTWAPSIIEVSDYLHSDGTNLYYANTMPLGQTFAVRGHSTDALSGIDRVRFSPALGTSPPDDTDGFTPWQSGPPDYVILPGTTASGLITARVYDRAGNVHGETYRYELDATPPTSTASSPAYATSSPFDVNWTAEDAQSGVYSASLWYRKELTGIWAHYETLQGDSGAFHFVPAQGNGLYQFAILAADNVGNVEAGPLVTETQTIYDTDVPQSRVDWAPAFRAVSPITVTWIATPSLAPLSEVALWYRLDGGAWISTSIVSTGPYTSGTSAFDPPADGTYGLATVASDAVAKSEAEPYGVGDATTVYDTQPPTVTIALPQPGATLTATLSTMTVQGTALDETAGITRVLVSTGTTWVAATGLPTWTLDWDLPQVDRATYTLRAQSVDRAGNVGLSAGTPVTVDTVAPSAVQPAPERAPWVTSTIRYAWPASSDGSGIAGYRVQVTNTAGLAQQMTTATSQVTFSAAYSEGVGYYARVRAVDAAGNAGAWSTPSEVVTADLTAPATWAPAIEERSAYLWAVGQALFYTHTMDIGQAFTITGRALDALSGLDRVHFAPALGSAPPDDTTPDTYAGVYVIQPGTTSTGTIAVTVRDRAGNIAVLTYTFELDGVPPTSLAQAPAYAIRSPIDVTWTATDTQAGVASTTLWYMKETNGTWRPYQTVAAQAGTFHFAPPDGDGLYLFATTAVDNIGNVELGPTVAETQAVYDTRVPESHVTWAPRYWNASPITVTWTVTPVGSPLAEVHLWQRTDDGPWQETGVVNAGTATSGTFAFVPETDGVYAWATVARDQLGRTEADPGGSGDAQTVYDTHTAVPTDLTVTPPGWTSTDGFALHWTNPPDLSGVVGAYYKFDAAPAFAGDGAWMPGADLEHISGIVVGEDGTHPLWLWLADRAGNLDHTAAVAALLHLDTTPPTDASIVTPEEVHHLAFSVSWSAQDAESGIAYYVLDYATSPGGSWQPWLPSTTLTLTTFVAPTLNQDYVLRMTAYDQSGNSAQAQATTRVGLAHAYLPLVTHTWIWWYEYDPYEPNDTPAQAYGPLTPGETYQAYMWDATDRNDYYTVIPVSDAPVQIALTHIPPGADWDLYVYEWSGGAYRSVAYSNQTGNVDENVSFFPQPGRTYYVRVYQFAGSSQIQPYYLRAVYQ